MANIMIIYSKTIVFAGKIVCRLFILYYICR
nr:MAG TPA: hypothetical protein [Caudoviricetes sp.]